MLDWSQVRYHYRVGALVFTRLTVYSIYLLINWTSVVQAKVPPAEYVP